MVTEKQSLIDYGANSEQTYRMQSRGACLGYSTGCDKEHSRPQRSFQAREETQGQVFVLGSKKGSVKQGSRANVLDISEQTSG
jgi:hypothetical protein